VAAKRIADALGAAGARIELRKTGQLSEDELSLPLELSRDRHATLLIEGVPEQADPLLPEKVVSSLEALLSAALDREELQREVVETQALRRSDEMKTALLRSASHDLRTPLTAIRTAGEALASNSVSPQERAELADGLVHEATRLSDLVDKLLDLSRLQAGYAEPNPDWCSIEELVVAASEQISPEKADVVQIALDPDLPLVRADAAQIERAFANLLENSVRYSGGHPVQIRGRVVGHRLVIRIIDRGPGISDAKLDHIFEPFYQTGDVGDGRGSGLGLAIVRGFIEVNGGQVWAESLPGQGTAFVIEFPLEATRSVEGVGTS
jgi:two-component system sensor histidine kinase KdpD